MLHYTRRKALAAKVTDYHPKFQSAESTAESKLVKTKRIVIPSTRVAHMRPENPRVAARTKLVRGHGNPLDAQAFDTRIQVWPCKSGGICNWKR